MSTGTTDWSPQSIAWLYGHAVRHDAAALPEPA
jgi:hypothetical protein